MGKDLGDYIRARRHELGLTQRQGATILKVNRVTLWHWENNRTEPEVGMYPRLVNFLGYCPYRCHKSFGELLWLHRAYRGWSKEKMARSLGVHPDTLSQWEQGTRSPTVRSMESVAGILRLATCLLAGATPRVAGYSAARSEVVLGQHWADHGVVHWGVGWGPR
jgi:transcriptional regulator with XRE-family HTH domain